MLIEIFAEIIFLLRSCVKGIVAVREKIRHFALKKKENPASNRIQRGSERNVVYKECGV